MSHEPSENKKQTLTSRSEFSETQQTLHISENTVDSQHIHRQIFALALPTFGQLIAEPAFILIDTAIVGHISDSALAGLSIGSTVILTVVGLCVFLAYGTTSQVGRLIGANRKKDGLEAGVDGLWLALVIGIVISTLLFLTAKPICALLGAQGVVLTNATHYLQAIVFGLPGMLLVYAANGIFRGLKKVRITLIAAVSGAIVNTLLEVLFVYGFDWGIVGSGAATLIAQWFMGIVLVVPAIIWAKKEGANCKPRLSGIMHSAADGVPLFIRTFALRFAMVATVMLAARMGTHVLAAYQAVNSTWNFLINILDAIGIAGQALVATELGAKRIQRAHAMTTASAKAGFVSGIVVGLLTIGFGFVGTNLFSPTPVIQQLITVGMVVLGLFLPLGGWMWAIDGILIGAGDFIYLAKTCTLTAIIYVPTLMAINAIDQALGVSDTVRMIILWAAINIIFVGIRAACNGLRLRTNVWMHVEA